LWIARGVTLKKGSSSQRRAGRTAQAVRTQRQLRSP
jgi:hypothetical protein